MGSANNKFKIPTKYLKDDFFLSKIENPQILVSTNMSILFNVHANEIK